MLPVGIADAISVLYYHICGMNLKTTVFIDDLLYFLGKLLTLPTAESNFNSHYQFHSPQMPPTTQIVNIFLSTKYCGIHAWETKKSFQIIWAELRNSSVLVVNQ